MTFQPDGRLLRTAILALPPLAIDPGRHPLSSASTPITKGGAGEGSYNGRRISKRKRGDKGRPVLQSNHLRQARATIVTPICPRSSSIPYMPGKTSDKAPTIRMKAEQPQEGRHHNRGRFTGEVPDESTLNLSCASVPRTVEPLVLLRQRLSTARPTPRPILTCETNRPQTSSSVDSVGYV